MVEDWLVRDLKLDVLFETVREYSPDVEKIFRRRLLQGVANENEINSFQIRLKQGMEDITNTRSIYEMANRTLEYIKPYKDSLSPKNVGNLTMIMKLHTYLQMTIGIVEGLCDIYKVTQNTELLEKRRTQLEPLKKISSKNGTYIVEGKFETGFQFSDICLVDVIPLENQTVKTNGKLINNAFKIMKKTTKQADHKKQNEINLLGEVKRLEQSIAGSMLNVVSQYEKNVEHELDQICEEYGFIIAAEILYKRLNENKIPICYPHFEKISAKMQGDMIIDHADGNEEKIYELTDLFLAIKRKKTKTNTIDLTGKQVVLITGANQGGKTTFLRSIGQAQLFAQSGLFVAAKKFNTRLYSGIFTHFPDEENVGGEGLLDIECNKFRIIFEKIKSGGMLLMNESFLTTTEKVAAKLAADVFEMCMKKNIQMFYVSHNYLFACYLEKKKDSKILFLRAQVTENQSRTYEIKEGRPERSAYALKLYHDIMNE